MVARLSRWIAVVVFLVPVLARAQGLLVVVDPAEHVRLPARRSSSGRRTPLSAPHSPAGTAPGLLQDRRPGGRRPGDRPSGQSAGFPVVREHGQPADGSGLHFSAALRRGHRSHDPAGRRQGNAGQTARAPTTPAGPTKRSCERTATRPCWSGSARACSRRASSRCRRGPSGPFRSATCSFAANRKE